jgi:hypothetical protein
MKSWLWKGMFAAVISLPALSGVARSQSTDNLPALSGVARAQSTDNDGCTNATLRGDYAFSVIDFILPHVVHDMNPRFRVTFTHAGTFAYYCALHEGLGMLGTVIVVP